MRGCGQDPIVATGLRSLLFCLLIGLLWLPVPGRGEPDRFAGAKLKELDRAGLVSGATPQQTWQQLGLRNYVYTLNQECYCPGPHNARVFVLDGRVVQVNDAESGDVISDPSVVKRFMTITGYFGFIERQYAQLPVRISVIHNKNFGYPEQIEVDTRYNIRDDEVTYRISGVREIVGPVN